MISIINNKKSIISLTRGSYKIVSTNITEKLAMLHINLPSDINIHYSNEQKQMFSLKSIIVN